MSKHSPGHGSTGEARRGKTMVTQVCAGRYCDQGTGSGGWTVVQRRGLPGPPYHNFTEDWYGYKDGFGDLTREFWWGNDNIHR